jgi:hypothetical protein
LRRWRERRRLIVAWALVSVLVPPPALTVVPAVARADGVPRLTFAQLVDALRANNQVSQSMRALSGKEVEIQGFIIPAGPPDLSFFLLSRVSALGNYCCEVPTGQDETVYVSTARGVTIAYDALRVYRVRGVFEAGTHVDPTYGVSMYRVRNATVEIAAGAKIFRTGEPPPAKP